MMTGWIRHAGRKRFHYFTGDYHVRKALCGVPVGWLTLGGMMDKVRSIEQDVCDDCLKIAYARGYETEPRRADAQGVQF